VFAGWPARIVQHEVDHLNGSPPPTTTPGSGPADQPPRQRRPSVSDHSESRAPGTDVPPPF
jgi:hypothetical protein